MTIVCARWVILSILDRLRCEFVHRAVIMDLLTRSISGWHLRRGLDHSLTLIALDRALAEHTPEIHHSDQGPQCAATEYLQMTRAVDAESSMTESGEAWQNGCAERLIRSSKDQEVDLSDQENATVKQIQLLAVAWWVSCLRMRCNP